MYTIALIIHVTTAIIGFGQTFLFPMLLLLPNNPAQIQYTDIIMRPMGKIAKYSDLLLFTSGTYMVLFGGWNFQQDWVWLAFVLFFTMRFSSRVLSSKTSSALKVSMSKEIDQIDIEEFKLKRRRYFPFLLWVQFLNLLIILDMIIKPNF